MFAAFGGFLYYQPSGPAASTINLWTWGYGGYGQIGVSDSASRSSPVQVGAPISTDPYWNNINVRKNDIAVVKSDGTLWAWGFNNNGELGLNDIIARSSPVQVGALTNWSKVYASNLLDSGAPSNLMAIKTDGTLWIWGDNSNGQLGQNDIVNRSSPVQVATSLAWASGGMGLGFAAAITAGDNRLFTWGTNSNGVLGTNEAATVARSSPVQVTIATGWSSISVGGQTLVGTSITGQAYAWGQGFYGALGNSAVINRSSPVQIGTLTGWTVSAGGVSTLGIRPQTGALYSWGGNAQGQLGLNIGVAASTYRSSPVQVGLLTNWADISNGGTYALTIKTDNTLWSWGNSSFGQMGIGIAGGTAYRSSPIQVGALSTWSKISAGTLTSMAIANSAMTVPNAPTNVNATPYAATTYNTASTSAFIRWAPPDNDGGAAITSYNVTSSPATTTQVAYGSATALVFTGLTVGTQYTFTVTATNRIGTGSSSTASNTVRLPALVSFYGTGTDTAGSIGDGNANIPRSSPIQVGLAALNWSCIGKGSSAGIGVMTTGGLFVWGANTSGQMGFPILNNTLGLNQLGVLTSWSPRPGSVSITSSTYAITQTGALYAWGFNGTGQLGNSTVVGRSSPVQVGTLTDWYKVINGGSTFLGIKTDGGLWAMGANATSQYGDGTVTPRSSPVLVSSSNNWKKVQLGVGWSAGLKLDGSLWVWGANTNGQQGFNNAVGLTNTVPAQITGTWNSFGITGQHMIAVKTDGTLWTWGLGTTGQLGLNDAVSRSSPTQVGALTTWLTALGGYASTFSAAIKTDGTLHAWGLNTGGQLGLNSIVNISSPVQVGSNTNWSEVPGFTNSDTSGLFLYSPSATSIVPSQPILSTGTALSAVAAGTGSAIINFAPPYYDGGRPITSYIVTSYPGGYTATVPIAQISFQYSSAFPGLYGSISISGLPSNVYYSFTVAAINSVGTGIPSSPTNAVYIPAYGKLYTWGKNNRFQLGDLTSTYRSSPVQIGADSTWLTLGSTNYNGGAIKTNGTLWLWGGGSYGGNGNSSVLNLSSPVQLGANTNWNTISNGTRANHFLATNTSGALYAWGSGVFGELGIGLSGAAGYRSSPVQVGSLTTWLRVYSGYYGSAAVKTDGTLWTWGFNGNGCLGLGDVIHRSSPVQVGLLTNWSSISVGYNWSLALKTDGTIWTWGSGTNGNLGQSDVTSRSSPIQIGALSTWSKVATSVYTGLGIKTDNTLWVWGSSGTSIYGTNTSSPVQIGVGKTWTSMGTFGTPPGGLTGGIQAIDSGGRMWAWGTNTNGAFGTNQTAGSTSTSPIQVGLLTTWKSVVGQGYGFVATNGT